MCATRRCVKVLRCVVRQDDLKFGTVSSIQLGCLSRNLILASPPRRGPVLRGEGMMVYGCEGMPRGRSLYTNHWQTTGTREYVHGNLLDLDMISG